MTFVFPALLAVVLLLAGCESTSFSDRLEAVPPQVQVVDGDVATVHRAALRAFKRLDFTVVRSPLGRIEAASAINTSKTFGDSRQIVARVRLGEGAAGRTEVQLTLTEEVSSSSLGGSRQQALREHSFFGTYYAMLQQVLLEQAAGGAAEKN